MSGRGLAVCTIAAKSYLPFARVLARSFRAHHPEIAFFLLLSDEPEGCFDPAAEPARVVRLAELEVPRRRRLLFGYGRRQVAVAVKPRLLGHLLDAGFERVVFLDADTWVVGDLGPLFAALERHSLVFTPHLLSPRGGRAGAARELVALRSGTWNLGVLGVTRDDEGRRFLAWWGERLATHCLLDVARGLHHDQRWCDLAPALFAGFHALRDAGVNVGYWDLPERGLEWSGGAARVAGAPARLLHFSGFDPAQPERVSRHSERPSMAELGSAAALYGRYAEAVLAAGWGESRSWPYAWGRFDDGTPIPDVARKLYRELGEGAAAFGDPFATGHAGCFADWLAADPDPLPSGGGPVGRIWRAIHARRGDLVAAFPDPLGREREAFRAWCATSGAREHEIAARFLRP